MEISLSESDFERPVKEIVAEVMKEVAQETLVLEEQCFLIQELVGKLEHKKEGSDFIKQLAAKVHSRLDIIIGPLVADVSDEDEKTFQEYNFRRHLLAMVKTELLFITGQKTRQKWLTVLKYFGFTSAGIIAGMALAKILRNGEDAEEAEKRLISS